MRFGIESFRWQEFDSAGSRLLEETGPRLVVGASYDGFRRTQPGFVYSVAGALYLGSVDYDGQTQGGVPVMSDSDYFGLRVEGLAGWRVGRGVGVDFFGGVGFDDWIRDIDDSIAADGLPAYGYSETYIIFYTKAGLGLSVSQPAWYGRWDIGFKYPIYTYEYVDLAGGVDLSPGRRVSLFAGFRADIGRSRGFHWGLALDYDSFRFSESDPEFLAGSFVVQPESEMDVVRAQVIVYFQ
ncbi:MAG TPA: hypothetical protein VGA00_12175 [Acidiferrobacterales bacterium]